MCRARVAGHRALDALIAAGMDKGSIYRWLSRKFGVPNEKLHFSMMTRRQARRIEHALYNKRVEFLAKREEVKRP